MIARTHRRGPLALLFTAGLVAACAVPAPEPGTTVEPGVFLDDEWIVYRGEITARYNRAARALRDRNPAVRGLRITSDGGNVDEGLALGEWLLAAGLDVYVDGYCYSSCANYVFPAGRSKVLGEHAVVGWHGGTRQWDSADAMCREALDPARTPARDFDACLAKAAGLREREAGFFALLGVDPSFTVRGLRAGANYPSAPTDVAWTYSLEDMARLGIGAVEVDGTRWQPRVDDADHSVCLFDLDAGRCGPLP